MHKIAVLLFLTILFAPKLKAQSEWHDDYYLTLNDETFRDFAPFNQAIDLNKPDVKLLNAAVFFVSNEARIEQDIAPLPYQANLEVMAWNHSVRMGEANFFDHYDKKSRKRKSPSKRARLAGIINPRISENITAIGGLKFGSYLALADAIVDNWIDSPPHRRALYSKDAVELGCGVYYYSGLWQKNKDIYRQGDGFWLATQNFQLLTKVVANTSKEKKPK